MLLRFSHVVVLLTLGSSALAVTTRGPLSSSFFNDCPTAVGGGHLPRRQGDFNDVKKQAFDFFLRHSTEKPKLIHALAKRIDSTFTPDGPPISLLDIGSSDGRVAGALEAFCPSLKGRTTFHIIEPDLEARTRATDLLGKVSQRPLRVWSAVPKSIKFDVILAIQVIYYFEDPWELIQLGISQLKPGGLMLLSVANYDNGPSWISRRYQQQNKNAANLPRTAEDIQSILDEHAVKYETIKLPSKFSFLSTPDNRRTALRFMIGTDLADDSFRAMDDYLVEKFLHRAWISIPLSDTLFVIRP